jgi:outer membrane lipoprotein-sorting protein
VTRAPESARNVIAAAMLLLGVACTMAAQTPQVKSVSMVPTQKASTETVVSRMTEIQYKNRHAIRPYIVTREYKLFDDKSSKADSQVVAEVSFVPPGNKQYEIKQTQGSGRGEKVVRKVLAHEQEMAGDWEESALTERNYSFGLVGEEQLNGRNCYVLTIEPRRESKDLIRGRVWVDSETYNPLRMVGQPAKNPSWWVKHVELSLGFSNVEGMWLQTSATANADVRIFGKHVLTSKDIRYETGSTDAKAKTRRRSEPTQSLGSAVIFAR